mmetsp:Transcript_3352/g.7489  ORF Transcript_3352/g.7489 Transcript_3352/m.7489 type:complete len:290 (-) Transcript_3352:719-1588(-)
MAQHEVLLRGQCRRRRVRQSIQRTAATAPQRWSRGPSGGPGRRTGNAGRGAQTCPRLAAAAAGENRGPDRAAGSSGASEKKKRLAVFVSGGGSNFRAIHRAIHEGRINASVELVVSDKSACGAVDYAREHGIATVRYPDKDAPAGDAGLGRLLATLREERAIDFVVLAGYLKMVPPEVVRAFPRGMLNMHPALLPAFGGKGYYGMNVHRAVVESGARFSGATVHFVDEEYDRGPIVAQACVAVSPEDTPEQVAAKVLKREHELFPHVVAALCDGRIVWREGKPLLWTAT